MISLIALWSRVHLLYALIVAGFDRPWSIIFWSVFLAFYFAKLYN